MGGRGGPQGGGRHDDGPGRDGPDHGPPGDRPTIIHGELEGVVGLNGADWPLLTLDVGTITALAADKVRGAQPGRETCLLQWRPSALPSALLHIYF